MTVQEVINLISNIGFPIACCIYMMFNNNKAVKENTEVIRSLQTLIEQKLQ